MSQNKVIARVVGGLGNQLFTYAAARRLAINNNAQLILDTSSGFINDHEYSRHYQLDHFNINSRSATYLERMEPFSRARRYLKRLRNAFRPFGSRTLISQDSISFDPRLLNLRFNGVLYLEGYWQSEGYFKDVEPVIRSELSLSSPPRDNKNLSVLQQICDCSSVAVHIRFFDPPNNLHPSVRTNNITQEYYKRAFEIMELRAPNSHYFIFSDRPNDARSSYH